MADSQEIAPLIAEFGREYSRKLFSELSRTGTTPARARLLMTLQCHGSCKMSELSTHLSVTPRSITKLVDSLEQEGLVLREAVATDRRVTLVHLTARGAQTCKESALANQEAVNQIFDQLSATDRAHLIRILKHLTRILRQ